MSSTLTLPSVPFEQFTLANGLNVILHQDKSVPVVAVFFFVQKQMVEGMTAGAVKG